MYREPLAEQSTGRQLLADSRKVFNRVKRARPAACWMEQVSNDYVVLYRRRLHVAAGIRCQNLQGQFIPRGTGFRRKERSRLDHFGQQFHRGDLQIRIERCGLGGVPRSKPEKERAARRRVQQDWQFSQANFYRAARTAAFLRSIIDTQSGDAI